MRDLEGTLMLVAGGAGAVGEGIVGALLRGGARVIVPSRSESRLAELGAHLQPGAGGRLIPLLGDVATPQMPSACALTSPPRSARWTPWWPRSAVGGRDPRSPTSISPRGTRSCASASSRTSSARARSRHRWSSIAGSYIIVNGASAYYPVPGSGLVSIAGSGLLMLARVLSAEGRPEGVTYRSVVLETSIITRAAPQGGPEWLTADEVGRFIARLIAEGGGDADDPIVRLQFKNQVPAE